MVGLELPVPHEARVSANRSWPPRCGRLPACPEDGDSEEGPADGVGEGSEEEAAGNVGVSPLSCSGGLPHTPPQQQPETLVEERQEGGDGDVCSSDGQFVRDCVVRRDRTGDGELERMEVNGSREKRWLTSAVNPPPKRRVVSAIRRFPRDSARYAVVDTSIGCWRNAVINTSIGGEGGYVFEATPISFTSGGVSAEDASHMVPTSILRRDVSNEETQGKREEVGGATEAHNHKIQQSNVGNNFVLDDFAQDQDDSDHPQNDVTKGSPRHGFAEKMDETRTLHERKPIPLIAADGDVRSKWNGRLRKGIPSTYVTGLVNVKTKGKRLRNPKMDVALLDAGVLEECMVRNDTSSTPRGVTHSNINVKQHMVTRKLKCDGIGIGKEPLNTSPKESKCVNHVATGQIEENNDARLTNVKIIVQALMALDKYPWRQGKKSLAGVSQSLARGDDVKIKNAAPRNELPSKVTPSTSTRHETREDKYSSLEENENSTLLVVHERNNKLCITLPSCVAFVDESVDAQSKVTKMDESTPLHERKNATRLARDGDARSKCEGSLLEGTSEFHMRDLVNVKTKGKKLESVKMNVTLPDDFEDGMMRYKTPSTKRGVTRSNIKVKQHVVAHGLNFDGIGNDPLNRFAKESKSGNHLAAHQTEKNDDVGLVTKKIIVLALMAPEKCPWTQGKKSIAGISRSLTHRNKSPTVREGLCLPDISQGKESIPICVFNTIDDMQPVPFKYITKVIFPPSYVKAPPKGCDCTNGCSDSIRCACAVKNGGELPFNFDSEIVYTEPVIYECGPSCRCPPTCHNRVSQHGPKIPLEIFKTGKTGWGVRSPSFISSGSFICEYVGELLQENDAEKTENDEYLFDIGRDSDDEEGLQSSTSETMDADVGYTIDAAKCGNVGRFINHSCSPNLHAQDVLWDHDDKRMPHVMLFAEKNIPPLQELTYDYNYNIGLVRKNGKEKVKKCFCGSSKCRLRLY